MKLADFAFPRGFRLATAALLAVFILGWFGSLEQRGLFIPDEGRYAEIAREMVATSDWTTPRLNDLKYFEKPPLQYWLTGLSFAVFGEDEWTARLPAALLGFIAVLMVGFTARSLWDGRAGAFAGTILGSSWAFYLSGQYLTLDMTLSAFLTMALCAFLLAQRDDATAVENRRWMLAAWAAAACAMLSKGLVGIVLPGLALAMYSVAARDLRIWKRLNLRNGIALFAIIVLPWFVLVQSRNPEFFHFFFIREHVQRFLETGHGRPGAWWYYLPILIIGLMPWTPLFVARALQMRRKVGRDASANIAGFNIDWFCLAWAVSIVLFFSFSRSKLPAYIVPALPALALWLCRMQASARDAALKYCAGSVLALGVLMLVGIVQLPGWSKFAVIGQDATDALPVLYVAAALLLVSGAAAVWTLGKARPQWAMTSLAAGTFAFWACMFAFLQHADAHFSSEKLIENLTNDTKPFFPHLPIYSVGQFDHSLPFYLGRPVTLVDMRGELGHGIDAEPHKALETMEQFQQVWRSTAGQAFSVMSPAQYRNFEQEGLPMVKMAEDKRLVVVSRLPSVNAK